MSERPLTSEQETPAEVFADRFQTLVGDEIQALAREPDGELLGQSRAGTLHGVPFGTDYDG